MAIETVLDEFTAQHVAHVELCNLLEEIANMLPNRVDTDICLSVTERLDRELPLHCRDHEEALFPLLRARAQPEDDIDNALRQLHAEHVTDGCGALDLIEMLPLLGAGRTAPDPNMCGYMLRSFFECYRRHLVWEQHIIIPIARKRLTEEDLMRLEDLMRVHRQI